jgi:5-methylcytosine-specific restriction endonuclease McrA
VPAELKTAVQERDNHRCVRPGCGATQRLQVHHYKIDYGKQGPTAYWNLATLCRHDHDLVTYSGHRLTGGPGNWSWIPPPP